MLVAGPLPGLVASAFLSAVGARATTMGEQLVALLFGLNALNLLPILPLDGGRLVKLAVADQPLLSKIFSSLSTVALLALGAAGGVVPLLFALVAIVAIWREEKHRSIARALRTQRSWSTDFLDAPESEVLLLRSSLPERTRSVEVEAADLRALHELVTAPRAGQAFSAAIVAGYLALAVVVAASVGSLRRVEIPGAFVTAPQSSCATTSDCEAECANTGGAACLAVAQRYDQGSPSPDYAKALRASTRACSEMFGAGCVSDGILTYYGRGGATASPKQAADLFEKACRLGDAIGCALLGRALLHGEGRKQNVRRSLAYLSATCRGGYLSTCGAAGDAAARAGDPSTAAQFYEQGCADGIPKDCQNLATHLLDGNGVGRDEARAVDLFRSACDQEVGVACANLADLVANRDGGTEQARVLRTRACEYGDTESCR